MRKSKFTEEQIIKVLMARVHEVPSASIVGQGMNRSLTSTWSASASLASVHIVGDFRPARTSDR